MQSKDDSLGMVYVRGGAPHTVKMVCFRDRLSETWDSLRKSSRSAVTAGCMCIFSSSLQMLRNAARLRKRTSETGGRH